MARLLRRVFGRTSAPSAPTIVSVEATSSTSIFVQWKASKKDGGSPITGYVVEYSPTSNPSFETQVVARDTFSTYLDGLTPSTEYDVRVRGENAVGRSVPSAAKRTKTDNEVTEKVDSVGDLAEGESSSVRSSVETSSEDSDEEETDLRVEEEEKLLREDTKNNDMDSFHRHLDELERLLSDDDKEKRRIKESVLCYAAYLGSTPVVEALIQKGVDINTMSRVPEHPSYLWKMSTLYWAAYKGHENIVKFLIEKGANLHSEDGDGDTLLHVAAKGGHIDCVQYLIDKGVGIVKNNYGWTPLHHAARGGHVGAVELLLQAGADVNIKDNVGWTPLHRAALEGKEDTVQLLIEKGADMNIKDNDGATPLHKAAKWGHVGAVDYLIQAGADVNIKDYCGFTPLDVAPQWGREAIVAYLKKAADPNMLEESESTGRQQEQRLSPQETDNSPSEEPPETAEKEEETEKSDHEEIDSHLVSLLEKYRHEPKIKHKSLKCLFTGPPRVGKTTLKKRLLKTIKNLLTSGIVSPSGGLEKPISVIIGETRKCVTVVMESDLDWRPQHDLLDEAQIVLEFIDKSHHRSLPTSLPTTVLPKPVFPTPIPAPAMLATATPVATTAVPSKSGLDSPTPREDKANSLDDAKKLMQEVLSSRKLRSIKDIEKTTTLYFMDTGGQPEFHEIMPIILNGPALHLIFFNLAFDLDEPIPIRFCHPGGTDSTITYVSSYTGKQMIFQLLSSLYYFSKSLSPDSEPASVLIGTHLDQLKEEDKMKINDSLIQLFTNVEFRDEGFLTYPTKDKSTIFTPVNNYSGDEEEIHELQAFLRQIIHDRFSPVELPSSWLLFHLLLRHRYENSPGVCKLADCQVLASGCGLDEKDVPQVLQYIHRFLGTILFYEEVHGLKEVVICDPNVLFERIYHLVAVSFGGTRVHHTSAAEVRKTGEIPSKVLERISSQPSSSLLTNECIIELLKHFKILTEVVSDESITYFMPCLLHPDNSLKLSCESLQALCPPPLLVCFNGNYIPIGIFSALIVKLSQSSWEPDRDIRYRNHILFHTDGVFPVELSVHPAYLEFHIKIANYSKENLKEVHQFCKEVRKTVVDTLKSILSLHEHTKKTKFQLGFYCPGSFQADGQPHFCGCLPRKNHIDPKAFVCSKSPRCQDQCRLPPKYTIWFEHWKDSETARDESYAYIAVDQTSRTAGAVASSETGQLHPQPPSAPVSTTVGILDEDDLHDVISAVAGLAGRWQDLGTSLKLRSGDLDAILSASAHSPSDCLRKVLTLWLKQNYNVKRFGKPTWRRLVEAVEDPVGGNDHALAQKIAAKHPAGN